MINFDGLIVCIVRTQKYFAVFMSQFFTVNRPIKEECATYPIDYFALFFRVPNKTEKQSKQQQV